MDAAVTVRAYYAALDEERYDDLEGLLAPGFTQDRPDRTFDDRDAFIDFMRDDRPHADTTHQLHGVFDRPGDATTSHDRHVEAGTAIHRINPTDTPDSSTDERETILVRGTLKRNDDTTIVRFVDVFDVLADRILALTTYTN